MNRRNRNSFWSLTLNPDIHAEDLTPPKKNKQQREEPSYLIPDNQTEFDHLICITGRPGYAYFQKGRTALLKISRSAKPLHLPKEHPYRMRRHDLTCFELADGFPFSSETWKIIVQFVLKMEKHDLIDAFPDDVQFYRKFQHHTYKVKRYNFIPKGYTISAREAVILASGFFKCLLREKYHNRANKLAELFEWHDFAVWTKKKTWSTSSCKYRKCDIVVAGYKLEHTTYTTTDGWDYDSEKEHCYDICLD